MENEKKLFLLDAYALIYRSYYAFIRNPRFTSKGLNTSAIFGFINTLLEILTKEKPSHIAVVFDPPGPTFRHQMYAAYKAHREETPEDIKKAVPYIKQLVENMGINIIEINGFEADDVVGTVAKIAAKNNFSVFMMTPDKDYCQLVEENIKIYKPGRSGNEAEILGVDDVKQRFNIVSPMQVIDILALMGDASDNVPGAPGIGEKTAMKLISEFSNLENIYNSLDQLKGKQREVIEEFKEQVFLSRKLVTIDVNVPFEFREKELKIGTKNRVELEKLLNELEFKTLSSRILGNGDENKPKTPSVQRGLFDGMDDYETTVVKKFKTIDDVKHSYHLIDTEEKINGLIKLLEKQQEFCFDTETTGLEWQSSELVGMSFAVKMHEAYYVPVPANKDEAYKIVKKFKSVFEGDIKKIGQNIKFDMLMLLNYDIELNGEMFDTLIAHYLLQPEMKHNLDYLCNVYLEYQPVPIEQLIGPKGKGQQSMRNVPVEKIKDYACEDADVTLQLKEILVKEIEKNKLNDLVQKVEMPLIKVLALMERAGFVIDKDSLDEYAKQLREEAINVEDEIYKLSGAEFNISSPKQLGELLFDRLKIDSNNKLTKTRQYSTSEETLAQLRDKHPIIDKILEYRSLRKLLSTYVEALPALVDPKTNKIHSSFNQAVVATGRLSSIKPNLQNIPIREERGREIRKAFIATGSENVLISADYSQIELRIMAHMSDDQDMIHAFLRNEDIHVATAAKIYNIPLPDVNSDMRRKAKTANFGIIYGISAFGLSQRLSISRSEAKELIEGYFKNFPKVKEYMDRSIKDARERGYVETLMGRRRYLPDINSRNGVVRGMAERNAINAPIQGTAADIIKLAMVKINNTFHVEQVKSRMILQVHDELIFDVIKSEADKVKAIVKFEMENAILLNVPLTVDIGTGANWFDAH